MGHFHGQRLDQEEAPAGDDLLDHLEGDAVIHGGLDGVVLEGTARLHFQFGIDEEALAQHFLFVHHAMACEERTVGQRDHIGSSHFSLLPARSRSDFRIASATSRASLLIATL